MKDLPKEKSRVRLATFFLDKKEDVEAYEAIVNNENCTIIRRDTVTLTQTVKNYDDGKLVGSNSFQRIQYIVEYEEVYV